MSTRASAARTAAPNEQRYRREPYAVAPTVAAARFAAAPPGAASPAPVPPAPASPGEPSTRLAAEYVLPLRWPTYRAGDVFELTDYLLSLAEYVDVTIVDGSPGSVFAAHHALWGDLVRHVQPAGPAMSNGKVAGVLTGIRLARHPSVILADDDVRYDRRTLERMVAELESADLVRPQNYFTTLPWHARWDTARSLLNRAVASDYPGTLGVSRDLVLELGGYDGDVLFENLELIRTIRAGGGRERRVHDLFVGRTPPTSAHFAGQRVRQAYDDFAQPSRLACELALLPILVWSARRPLRLALIAATATALAEIGRRRGGGTRVFPPTSALWAPAWLLERAICVWIALGQRMLGGTKYGGSRLKRAATPLVELRQKFANVPPRSVIAEGARPSSPGSPPSAPADGTRTR